MTIPTTFVHRSVNVEILAFMSHNDHAFYILDMIMMISKNSQKFLKTFST